MTDVDENREAARKLKNDMEVLGSDGSHIGHIREVRPDSFLLHRPLSVSVFVPFHAIDTISESDNRVILKVSEGQIAESGWPSLEADQSARKPLGGT